MNWLIEWKALSAQIQGLLEASRFYIESLSAGSKSGQYVLKDSYKVGNRQLLPHIEKICAALEKFRDVHKGFIPTAADESLTSALNKIQTAFPNLANADAFNHVHVMVTLLVSFRAEFEYHLSDSSAVARRLSERAFIHLQRSIIVDTEIRRKWTKAFEEGEPHCEKLGGVHLLLHGIWAFKVNAEGERTDLVFGDPLPTDTSIERSAEALVLTEWKRVTSPKGVDKITSDARRQAARYTSGGLAGLELARYRFIVLVSKTTLAQVADHLDGDVTYRHINIAVDPESPSKG